MRSTTRIADRAVRLTAHVVRGAAPRRIPGLSLMGIVHRGFGLSTSGSAGLVLGAVLLGVFCGLLLSAAPAAAQPVGDPNALPPAPEEGDVVIWYRVQDGDTLQKITEDFLGTAQLWRENHRLNPSLANPHRLRPGQWLRIIESRPTADRFAEVGQVAGDVQALLYPSRTKAAEAGDRLVERDGVQTAQSSSTRLRFDDDSNLDIGERSLVFLEVVDQTLTGVRREMIEIRRGQAEVTTRSAGPRSNREIEIRVGGARARPTVGADGRAQTRARRDESGGAKVMVYTGDSEVEAAGATVAVPEGMGSAVPESGPPSPPEKLLAAPALTTPSADAALPYSNPHFRWRPVTGAVSYVVEFCEDAGCTRLLRRRDGLTDPQWDADEALPVGAGHWRVTAVSASGLDGYPSSPRPLTLQSPTLDVESPVVVARIVGAGRAEPAANSEGRARALMGPGGGLSADAHDDAAGVVEIRYRWNEDPWTTLPRPWSEQILYPPAQLPATLELLAVDERGRDQAPVTLTVARDEDPLAAPTVSWQPQAEAP